MDTLAQDLRLALRKLRKSPGFTAVALATLALGIGANAAIFSVVDAVLLRPLPMQDPDAVVRLYSGERGEKTGPTSGPDFLDLRAQQRSFTDLVAMDATELSIADAAGAPERLHGAEASARFFDVLGVRAHLGRTFAPDEDQPGKPRVVILGHALWQRRYGGSPGVLGSTLQVGGHPYTVIGVLPPGFDFPERAQLVVPIVFEGDVVDPTNRGAHWLSVYGRLKPGVTLAQAEADVAAVAARLEAAYPQSNTGKSAFLTPVREELTGDVRPALLVLLGAVGLVLLIACANLSNLLLARAASREGELSVRLALGATRGQLVRQLLVESVVLAVLGGGLGVLLAGWALDALVALGPSDIPRLEQVAVDGSVLAYTAGVALLTALLFGLAPALQATRLELGRTLRDVGAGRGQGSSRHRTRSALIVLETALAVVLLVGAGLLLRSFTRLQQVDPGFRPEGVLTLQLSLPEGQYKWGSAETARFYEALMERVRALPGVRSAGAAFQLPLDRGGSITTMRDEALPEQAPGQEWRVRPRVVTPGYLETMHIRLVRGRLLTEADRGAAGRVVVLSEEAARRYWPGQEVLGRTVELGMTFGDNGEMGGTVVGIVGSVRHGGLGKDPFPEAYVPFDQARGNIMSLTLRTDGDPMALAPLVRKEVAALDASLPLARVATMEAIVGSSVAQPRFYALLVGVFAALALVLAAVGLSGVVAHAVGQRRQELGIRMALGARAGQVLAMVLRQYLGLTAVGLALGVVGALALSRVLTGMLFGVEPADPATYAGVTGVLALVATLAAAIPARNAARVDPAVALKAE